MNDACERIRGRIVDSIGRALGADEQAALDLHCAECESCREYRKRLIDDHSRLDRFAALHSSSERRAEEHVIAAIPAEAPVPARRWGIQRVFPSVPRVARIAFAAAIVLAAIVGIDFLRDVRNGPVPAFASVLERVDRTENVIYRYRRWSDGLWITYECASNSNTVRRDYGDSIVVMRAPVALMTLALYPAQKRAVACRLTNPPVGLMKGGRQYKRLMENSELKRLADLPESENYTFVRRERCEGKMAALYEWKSPRAKVRQLVWIDLDSQLPMRMETIVSTPGFAADSSHSGLRLSDFLPAGASRSEATGWVDLGAGEPNIVFDNFRWNAPVDTSYFSLNPPAGYAVTRIDETRPEGAEIEEDLALYYAQRIGRALSIWLSCSGNTFPDDIRDMADAAKFRPLLVAKYNRDGVPGEEYRKALHVAGDLRIIGQQIDFLMKDGLLHYIGKGCAFGDSTKVICWMQERKNGPYAIIYADLRCVSSPTPPTTSKK